MSLSGSAHTYFSIQVLGRLTKDINEIAFIYVQVSNHTPFCAATWIYVFNIPVENYK